MKNILTGAIILIFISLQANGQQPQDTMYLKNRTKQSKNLSLPQRGISGVLLPDESSACQ